jgi:hypothetical protein
MVAAAAVSTGAMLSGCASVETNGPLVGPRVGTDEVRLCSPADGEGEKYYSELLVNTADVPVSVTSVTAVGDGRAEIRYWFDLEGADDPLAPASWWWPSDNDAAGLMSRRVDAENASIPADHVVRLVIGVTPMVPNGETTLSDTIVEYQVGDTPYREHVSIEYALISGDDC